MRRPKQPAFAVRRARAARAGAEVVVRAGGDGTVMEVVNAPDGHERALGILPLGTANKFARQTGIRADADHVMDVILRRNPVCIDTASLNGRRVLRASIAGIGAATADTPSETKESLGPMAYSFAGTCTSAELEAYEGRPCTTGCTTARRLEATGRSHSLRRAERGYHFVLQSAFLACAI